MPELPHKLPTIKRATPSNAGARRYEVGRPGGRMPSQVVVHSTVSSGPRASSAGWLSTHPAAGVSCHTLANRDGSLTEIVPPMWTAYHAGRCIEGWGNSTSCGLELENSSNGGARVEPYPLAMIIAGAYRTATWCFSFGIPLENVRYHRDVAIPPGRKIDPVLFPDDFFWHWLRSWLDFLRSLPPELHALYIV